MCGKISLLRPLPCGNPWQLQFERAQSPCLVCPCVPLVLSFPGRVFLQQVSCDMQPGSRHGVLSHFTCAGGLAAYDALRQGQWAAWFGCWPVAPGLAQRVRAGGVGALPGEGG